MSEPEPLSFDDVQILRLESDAIKGHTGKVLVTEPAGGERLSADALRDRVAERIGELPRLRERVELGPGDGASWVPDDDVDLNWHVAAHEGDGPLSEEGFRALAGQILAERLDHERPLWRFDVVPLEGDRAGLIGRIHHAMADGVTAIRTIGEMFWDVDAPPGANGAAKGGAKAKPKAPAAEHRERPLLVRLPGTLRRELKPGRHTVLDQHIGSGREVAWTAVPLEQLRGIGHRGELGATVNDVVLAVVAGGLHSWLQGKHAPATLRAQIPVCMHLRDGDASIGNKDSFLNVDLPIAEPDPVERLRRIATETRVAKLDHDAETLYSFFHSLARFGPLYRGVTRVITGPREFALSVSNVPGPRDRPTICGHELREFCSFAEPADRHALRVAVISLGGDIAFGLCSDPEAVGGLDQLADALEQSLVELDEAVPA